MLPFASAIESLFWIHNELYSLLILLIKAGALFSSGDENGTITINIFIKKIFIIIIWFQKGKNDLKIGLFLTLSGILNNHQFGGIRREICLPRAGFLRFFGVFLDPPKTGKSL